MHTYFQRKKRERNTTSYTQHKTNVFIDHVIIDIITNICCVKTKKEKEKWDNNNNEEKNKQIEMEKKSLIS